MKFRTATAVLALSLVGAATLEAQSRMLRGALQYFHEPENDDYFSYSNLGLIPGISFFVK
jgi:hypothetical protein